MDIERLSTEDIIKLYSAEKYYKNRRKISIAVLISIVFTLLLSLNFHIWSDSYTEGDLESVVIQQMEEIKKGNIDGSIDRESVKQKLHLFDHVCLSDIEINAFFLCEVLSDSPFGYFFLRPSITLCSLSVRMNN